MQEGAIRIRLTEEHDALRQELQRTETLATEFRQQGLQLVGPLKRQVQTLLEQLRKHMDWEESALAGLASLEEPHLQHREQCELLESLIADLGFDTRPPTMIAAHVAAIAGLLRRDFLEEERKLASGGAAASES